MRPHTIDISDWTDEEIAQVRSEAVFSGYDVLEDAYEGQMIVTKAKPTVRHKAKKRFFE